MNGTVIFGGIVLFFIISGLVNFIGNLEDDVDSKSHYSSSEMNSENYYDTNVVGEQIIVLHELSQSKKREIWNKSTLKSDMMNLFPNFALMSEFVEDRMIDDSDFKKKLLKKIESVEEKYIGGVMSAERAKATLSSY